MKPVFETSPWLGLSTADSPPTSVGELALRLLLATAAAAVIGWDREKKNRPAGLRTHILVGLGSCTFVLLGLDAYERFLQPQGRIDPLRIVEGIVGGIGFLCAGTIMQSRGAVHGLTTAAGIWVVAAVGVAAALGSYSTLAITFAITALTLTLLGRVERRFIRSKPVPGAEADGTGGTDGEPVDRP